MIAAKEVIVRSVGLTKVFKDFWGRPKAKAVSDVDIEVRQGEIFGLLGPNGAGKSTFVKMMLGLLYPTGGHLTIFGQSPKNVDIKKRIGYLPEETNLYKHLTAAETLDFFGALFNISGPERKARTDQLLKMVGLEHARNRPVGEFSKGMARRIGLAQAMINDPDLLILDEPTNGLDPIGCKEIKDLLVTLRERGKTVLVTSHLLSDLEDICDRVVVLYGGRVRAEGELESLLAISEKTCITAPALDDSLMDAMMAFLAEHFSDDEIEVDRPHMSLESFFLNVIDSAQEKHLETDGVESTGGIADYLAEGVDRKVLDALVQQDGMKLEDRPCEMKLEDRPCEMKLEDRPCEMELEDRPCEKPVLELEDRPCKKPVLDEFLQKDAGDQPDGVGPAKDFEESNKKLANLLDKK